MNKLAEMDEIDYKKNIKDGVLYLRLLDPPNFPKIREIARILSGLMRLKILFLLDSDREHYNKKLSEFFNRSPRTIRYHLNQLKKAGLISTHRQKNGRFYKKVITQDITKIVIDLSPL
ncbi:MAG: ArsR family transcriptional regulator [Candidatus Lokiarchaeota archaeon]|nr:ArsR family transcriptional regulator [Candidatus Lokiarchaeota archaeon]